MMARCDKLWRATMTSYDTMQQQEVAIEFDTDCGGLAPLVRTACAALLTGAADGRDKRGAGEEVF